MALLAAAVWRVVALLDVQQAPRFQGTVGPVAIVKPAGVNLASIQRANLFGQAAAGGGSGVDIPTVADLVLAGVFSADDPLAGLAMLGPSAASIAVYRTGAEVSVGVKLQSVYRDYVLLDRNGQLVRLEMPHVQLLGATSSAPVALTLTPTAQAFASRPVRAVPRPNPNVPLMPGQVMRTQIVRTNGKLQGFRLFPGAEQKVFDDAGLRNGDIVVAVNGRKPGEPASDLQQVLGADRSARLTILRGGVKQELMVSLDGHR